MTKKQKVMDDEFEIELEGDFEDDEFPSDPPEVEKPRLNKFSTPAVPDDDDDDRIVLVDDDEAEPEAGELDEADDDEDALEPLNAKSDEWEEKAREIEAERQKLAEERRAMAREYLLQVQSAELSKVETQRTTFDMNIKAVDSYLAQAKKALVAALDEDDHATELEARDTIEELRQLRAKLVASIEGLPTDDAIRQHFEGEWRKVLAQQPKSQPAPQSAGVRARADNKLAAQWQDQNAWMSDPKHADIAGDVVAISNSLAKRGIKADTPEHFARLTRTLHSMHPDIGVKGLTGQKPGQKKKQTSTPVASPRTAGAKGSSDAAVLKSGKIKLGDPDFARMRMLNLDPSNAKHREHFARGRVERMRMNGRMN